MNKWLELFLAHQNKCSKAVRAGYVCWAQYTLGSKEYMIKHGEVNHKSQEV